MTHRAGLCVAVVLFCSFLVHATEVTGTVSDSASGAKLANAIVSLRSANGGTTIARDTTGADGVYSITDTATPGELSLRATLSGYLTKNTAITIDTSEASMTSDFQLVKIDTTSVGGTISDSTTPTTLIEGAIVSLRSGNTTVQTDTTGADGKYQFDIVATGTYTVRAAAASYTTKSVPATVSGSSPVTVDIPLVKIEYATVSGTVTDSVTPATLIEGAIVSLRSGNSTVQTDTTGADGKYQFDSVATGTYTIRAAAASYTTKSLPATVSGSSPVTVDIPLVKIEYATVSGTVTDSVTPATLIEGAIVSLRSGNSTVQTDTTGADGKYQFDSVATGTYTIRAAAASYTTKSLPATVSGSSPVTVDIPLVKIVYVTVSGAVTDSATPTTLIEGAIVSLRSGNSTVQTDTTGADGKYQFDSIRVGNYTIRAAAALYVTKTVDASVTSATPVTVDIALVKVVISSVSGTVSDSATPATLIEGAIVSLRSGNSTVQTDTTGADGKYQFTGIPVGNYTVRVTASGYTVKSVSSAVPDTTPVTVNIALVKIQYGSLSGTVKDSASGASLTGAIVTVRSGNMSILADTTGDDGKYSFDSIPTGIYTIRATDSSYMSRSVVDTVKASTAGTIDFLLVLRASVAFDSRPDAALRDYFTLSSKGVLSFGSGARAGDIAVFALDGKELYRNKVGGNTLSLALPKNMMEHGNALIIRYRGPGFSYRMKTLKP